MLKQIAGIKAAKEVKAVAVAKPAKATPPAPAAQPKPVEQVKPEQAKPLPRPAPAPAPAGRPPVPHGHVDRDDPIAAQARKREQEREDLHKAITKWLSGGGKPTDSIALLRRAIDGDDVSSVKRLLDGSAVNDRTCAVKESDIERAAERQCSDPMFKLLIRGEGTAHDTDSLKKLADRFRKGSAASNRLQPLVEQVDKNNGDMEAAGLGEPKPENKALGAGPSMGGGGGPKFGK